MNNRFLTTKFHIPLWRKGAVSRPRLLESTEYEIRIMGHLDERRMRWFEGLTISSSPNGETSITGPIIDQAALHGILNLIRDLGLPLLLVRRSDFRWEKDVLTPEKESDSA